MIIPIPRRGEDSDHESSCLASHMTGLGTPSGRKRTLPQAFFSSCTRAPCAPTLSLPVPSLVCLSAQRTCPPRRARRVRNNLPHHPLSVNTFPLFFFTFFLIFFCFFYLRLVYSSKIDQKSCIALIPLISAAEEYILRMLSRPLVSCLLVIPYLTELSASMKALK